MFSSTPLSPGDVAPDALLARNRATYERILGRALWHASRLALDHAAAWAETAADHAWNCHPGFFVDDRLERLLATLVTRNTDGAGPRREPPTPGSVLHVLTEAYPIGGHSRFAWRWIELDRSRRHVVVLTRQSLQTPVPESLAAAARAAAGSVVRLDWRRQRPRARAAELRRFASDFDLVVIHAHPFDIVPAMAFAAPVGPPVVVLNHASYAFWVGHDSADLVTNLRPSSRLIALTRRGFGPERCPMLPIPVERPQPTPSRNQARAALNLPPDAVLLLTVAAPYKYLAFEPGPSFLELVTDVTLANDRVRLCAIGPADEGAWGKARQRTNGRIRALGPNADVDLHARAADLYLDSFPVTSPTSLLEVGRYGVPIVSIDTYADRAAVLCADDATPDDIFVRETAESFVAGMRRLVADRAYRQRLGRATAEAILEGHGPEAIARCLEVVYASAVLAAKSDRSRTAPLGEPDSLDRCLVQMQMAAGLSRPFSKTAAQHLDAFPHGAREWLRLRARLERRLALTPATGGSR
jgi:hypothetical protein